MKGFRVIQEVMHPNGGVWEVILGHDHFEFLKKTLLWINIRKGHAFCAYNERWTMSRNIQIGPSKECNMLLLL